MSILKEISWANLFIACVGATLLGLLGAPEWAIFIYIMAYWKLLDIKDDLDAARKSN